jgi:hypothetical protein
MCGLCGVISYNLTTSDIYVFKQLLRISQLRGEDSTGACVVFQNDKTERFFDQVWKQCDNSSNFLDAVDKKNNNQFDSMIKVEHTQLAIMGHCRAATKGNVTLANAHPFRCYKDDKTTNHHIVGAHNGTLHSDTIDHKTKDNTDSEALFKSIAEKGLKPALEYIHDKVYNRAYALSIYDATKKQMQFIRNYDRPLWFAYSKLGSLLFWASEREMLEFILPRNKIKIDEMKALPPNTLMTVDLDVTNPIDHIEFIENYIPFKTTYYNDHSKGDVVPWKGQGEWDWANIYSDPFLSNTTRPDTPKTVKEVLDDVRTKADANRIANEHNRRFKSNFPQDNKYTGYQKLKLTHAQYIRLISNGCKYCEIIPSQGEAIKWISNEFFLCKDCKDEPLIAELSNRRDAASIIG